MARFDFTGKTVLVSGAGSGLGKAAALQFAQSGANLVLTDRDEAALNALCASLQPANKVVSLTGNVTDAQLHRDLVALALNRFGSLDVALNNAGIGHTPGRLEGISSEEARRVLDVDVLAILHAMKAQLPVMCEQYERSGNTSAILNTSSAAGVVGSPTLSVYAAAKHAVIGLTKSAAIENARKGVRINAFCPAFTRTRMVDELISTSPHEAHIAEQRLASNIPMGRIGEVDEVVQAMLWACDPENTFYTGQALVVDGGLSAG